MESNTLKLKKIRSNINYYKKLSLLNNNNNELNNVVEDIIVMFQELDDELSHGMTLPEDWQ